MAKRLLDELVHPRLNIRSLAGQRDGGHRLQDAALSTSDPRDPLARGAALSQHLDRLCDATLPGRVGFGPGDLQHVPGLIAV